MATEIVEAMKRDGLTRQQAEQVVRGCAIDVKTQHGALITWVRVGSQIVRENNTYGGWMLTRRYFDVISGRALPF